MNSRLIQLINLVNEFELLRAAETKLRDRQYEISWTYNYGDPYFYVAHDGFQWSIDQYLPPSQNQFQKIDDAVNALWTVLKERFKLSNMWFEQFVDNAGVPHWTADELKVFVDRYNKIVGSGDE